MSMPAGAFAAAVQTVEAANREEVPLKLLGWQAVRYLTPDFPPRLKELCERHGILYVDDEVQAGDVEVEELAVPAGRGDRHAAQ